MSWSIEDFDLAPFSVGEGGFSKVRLAKEKKSGFITALKFLTINDQNKLKQLKSLAVIEKEIRIHKSLDHNNIVKMFACFRYENQVVLILEYIPNGDLFQFITEKRLKRERFNEDLIKHILRQILQALSYLHQKGYIHRDLKPENILVTHESRFKICDFGLATKIKNNKKKNSVVGTLEYAGPEMRLGFPITDKFDIWAIGIIMFELIGFNSPFKREIFQEIKVENIGYKQKLTQLYKQGINKMREALIIKCGTNQISIQGFDFWRKCMKINQDKRLNAEAALSHPFLRL